MSGALIQWNWIPYSKKIHPGAHSMWSLAEKHRCSQSRESPHQNSTRLAFWPWTFQSPELWGNNLLSLIFPMAAWTGQHYYLSSSHLVKYINTCLLISIIILNSFNNGSVFNPLMLFLNSLNKKWKQVQKRIQERKLEKIFFTIPQIENSPVNSGRWINRDINTEECLIETKENIGRSSLVGWL